MTKIPKTLVSLHDQPVNFLRRTAPNPLPPIQTYATPEDVPVPLRHTLILARQSGLSVWDIATVFDLPEQWVALFTDVPKGSA